MNKMPITYSYKIPKRLHHFQHEIQNNKPFFENKIEDLNNKWRKRQIGFCSVLYENPVEDIRSFADEIRPICDNFIVVGMGGSALGNKMLHHALNTPDTNPRVFIIDNCDPDKLCEYIKLWDLEKSIFNFISKSGKTDETVANFLVIQNILKQKMGEKHKKRIIITTGKNDGFLRRIAIREGYKTFDIPEDVGGRFSVLTPVGLLSASVSGINITQLIAGAVYMDHLIETAQLEQNLPYINGALHYTAMKNGLNTSVMMPYSEKLSYFADWYAQLWAESLGKKYDLSGNEIRSGQTPVKALGTTDQHSLLQLINEGPLDKVVTFIEVKKFNNDLHIPSSYDDEIKHLSGKTLGELINIELKATEQSLTNHGVLNCKITLPAINEFTLGQLIYMYEIQTAYMGELLNINAFDQPGVEECKKLVKEFCINNKF